jgi:hypothetical protein
MKVLLALAVLAVVAGLGVHWARDKATSAIHHAIDTALPEKVAAHPWAPVNHGKPVGSGRVVFSSGTLSTVRCHAALGTYTVHIDHAFWFRKSATPVRAGCPGRRLSAVLRHATRVDVTTEGRVDTMTFTNKNDHTLATLRSQHR